MQSARRPELQPFLKWAGGKRWLSARVSDAFASGIKIYREPFLGSGAVYFHNRPNASVLSDINADLIECYLAIKADPCAVGEALSSLAALDPDQHYYTVRGSHPNTPHERAARFIYLNRTCWNGLYRVNKFGEFNVPRGTKTQIILASDDFPAIAESLSGATISVMDFEENVGRAQAGDLIFCDPPYTVAHNQNGFIKYNQKLFSWADQERLACALLKASSRGAKVIATNADHPDVHYLYKDFPVVSSISRSSVISGSVNGRKLTSELFIANFTF